MLHCWAKATSVWRTHGAPVNLYKRTFCTKLPGRKIFIKGETDSSFRGTVSFDLLEITHATKTAFQSPKWENQPWRKNFWRIMTRPPNLMGRFQVNYSIPLKLRICTKNKLQINFGLPFLVNVEFLPMRNFYQCPKNHVRIVVWYSLTSDQSTSYLFSRP